MTKILVGVITTLAMVSAAAAADLPRRQPAPVDAYVGKAPVGKAPIGKAPVGKYPVGKSPVVAKG